MTRFSTSMAITCLMMSLAPAAQAYGTDPATHTLRDISQVGYITDDHAVADGTCQIKVTPELASILGLSDDWRTGEAGTVTALACEGDN